MLHYGPVPAFDSARWRFTISGLVDKERTLTWAEWNALPTVKVYADIHCVTRWSKLDTAWEGVAIQTVLERAGVKPEGKFVLAHCEQGYTTNMPLCIALAVREMRMTPDEAVYAATAGGAAALRDTNIGALTAGRAADFVVLTSPSHIHLAYRPGVPQIAATYIGGGKASA